MLLSKGQPAVQVYKQSGVCEQTYYRWREITRYLSYDGTAGSGFHWAEPADPARYRQAMDGSSRLLSQV